MTTYKYMTAIAELLALAYGNVPNDFNPACPSCGMWHCNHNARLERKGA